MNKKSIDKVLKGKSILVTGGTGSFGKKFAEIVLREYEPKRIIVLSRDELKQFDMRNQFPDKRLEFFIGDVRDKQRIHLAFRANIDIIIHAAAMKQITTCERNPFEAIKTNVIGAQNIIDEAMESNVKKIIALSTDKAAAPINLYGATKLAADKLFIAANNYVGWRDTRFSVVRYGNVMGSRGSVIPYFMKMKSEGVLPVTDDRMTRFNITLEEAVYFTLKSLLRMEGKEIFIPKIPSYRIMDLAKAIGPECKTKIVGIRAGEKIHEEMVTITDALSSLEYKDHYRIYPSVTQAKRAYKKANSEEVDCNTLEYGFSYDSQNNPDFLSVNQLVQLIKEYSQIRPL